MLANAKHPRGVQGGPVSLLVEDRLEMYLANLREQPEFAVGATFRY